LAHENENSTSSAVAAVEATVMQCQWRLWQTTGGGGGVGGGIGDGVGGTVATVG
jgi:hypothetical protein